MSRKPRVFPIYKNTNPRRDIEYERAKRRAQFPLHLQIKTYIGKEELCTFIDFQNTETADRIFEAMRFFVLLEDEEGNKYDVERGFAAPTVSGKYACWIPSGSIKNHATLPDEDDNLHLHRPTDTSPHHLANGHSFKVRHRVRNKFANVAILTLILL